MESIEIVQYIEVRRVVRVVVTDGGTIEDARDILNEMPLNSNLIDPAQGCVTQDWGYVADSDTYEDPDGNSI